jgi:hypothetical protein
MHSIAGADSVRLPPSYLNCSSSTTAAMHMQALRPVLVLFVFPNEDFSLAGSAALLNRQVPFFVLDVQHGAALAERLASDPTQSVRLMSMEGSAMQDMRQEWRGQPTAWSSLGPGMDLGLKPDIAAPGAQIYSAAPGNRYHNLQGTSMVGTVYSAAQHRGCVHVSLCVCDVWVLVFLCCALPVAANVPGKGGSTLLLLLLHSSQVGPGALCACMCCRACILVHVRCFTVYLLSSASSSYPLPVAAPGKGGTMLLLLMHVDLTWGSVLACTAGVPIPHRCGCTVEAAAAATQGHQAGQQMGCCSSTGAEEHCAPHPLRQQHTGVAPFEDRSRPCEGGCGDAVSGTKNVVRFS